ncbi:MAG TPA: FAD-dependent oxidoreductase [Alcaligenes sp.]|nr:FAD-dependent oxidoreductase [Alcaligenes sp.]HRL26917.1 FAD-dependent oxidoreductase [Alcaligenes sp.]
MAHTTIVAGAGHAGVNLAVALRKNGYAGKILLMEAQSELPYQRPPLSKGYLLGQVPQERLAFRPADFFQAQQIELHQAGIDSIDPEDRTVSAQGQAWNYDTLVLALGSRPRRLAIQSQAPENVFSIATLDQARALKQRMPVCGHAVVLGAGFIGLEFARAACAAGMQVTVVDSADRVMSRSLPPSLSEYVRVRHELAGVQFVLADSVLECMAEGNTVIELLLQSGRRLPLDLLVVGVGSDAQDELAAAAGLQVQNGVLVDAYLQTGTPGIYAIGDCARVRGADGRSRRLESVQNAHDQARYLAARLMGQEQGVYKALPWYWSDQGDVKIQIAGEQGPYDQVRTFVDEQAQMAVAYCFSGPGVAAVATVNCPAAHMVARRQLAREGGWDLSLSELQSADFDAFQRAGVGAGV